MTGRLRGSALLLVSLVLLAAPLQGCLEDEQGRAFLPDKGEYRGRPDRPLSERQVEELRERARAGDRM